MAARYSRQLRTRSARRNPARDTATPSAPSTAYSPALPSRYGQPPGTWMRAAWLLMPDSRHIAITAVKPAPATPAAMPAASRPDSPSDAFCAGALCTGIVTRAPLSVKLRRRGVPSARFLISGKITVKNTMRNKTSTALSSFPRS